MAFMGMRDTGNWPADYVPYSWANKIMYENPQGIAPLFAMSSMFGKISVPSTTHTWWTKTTPTRALDLTAGSALYYESALTNAYAYTDVATYGIKGATLYLKVTADYTTQVNTGKILLLQDKSNLKVGVQAKVKGKNSNGANSYIVIELLEADDNADTPSATASLQSVDRVFVLTSAFGEGSPAPTSIVYDPTQVSNNTEIFRNTYDQTGTALATEIRPGDPMDISRRDCVEQQSQDIEWAGIWGEKLGSNSEVDANGKPLRKTQGFVPFLREYNASNIVDFVNGSTTSGLTWLSGGADFLNDNLTSLARFAGPEVMCLCGDLALTGVEKLAMTYGHFNLKEYQPGYGMKFRTWVQANTTVHFASHPLLSLETSTRNVMLLYKPENIRFAPLEANGISRDTKHQENMQVPGVDGKMNGFLTEGMWMFDMPNQFMAMFGVGQDGAGV